MNFNQLGLSDAILKSLDEQEYKIPTPIQAKAIPAIMEGKDVMAAAQTGTGKTAGFTLPILDRLSKGEHVRAPGVVRTLVLTPTRELAAQVAQSIETYGKHLSITSTVVFGGVKIGPQMSRLRKGVDILVATPGRLLDLYQQNALNFKQLEVLVLDEADRMLDMGFIHDIKKIIAVLPRKRQNLLFSATFSNDIRDLAKGLMNNPVEISVSAPNSTVSSVEQWVHPVDKKQKTALLSHLIWEGRWEQVLVFVRTKHGANRLAEYLVRDGMTAVAIHGNKSQGARTKALKDFKAGEIRVLVATDIAARGLDIELLPHVVNFDLPHVAEDYIHRIGRTGRAGASGEAISLVSADEFYQLADIERLIKQKLERRDVDGFEPKHTVPERNEEPRRASPRQNRAAKPSQRYLKKDGFENKKREGSFATRDGRFGKDERPARGRTPRDDRFTRNTESTGRGERSARDDRRPARTEWSDKSDRPRSDSRAPKKEWTPRGEQRAPKREWSDRSERPARTQRTKSEWSPRNERSDSRDDRPARDNRAPKREWSQRDDRPARPQRAYSGERSAAPRGDRPVRKEWADKSDRPARSYSDRRDDRAPKREFSDRDERPARGGDRPVRSDRSYKGARPARAASSSERSGGERSFARSDKPATRTERSFDGERSERRERPQGDRPNRGARPGSGPRRPSRER